MFIRSKNKLMISVNDGVLEVLSLKIEGKKKVNALEFINGINKNKFKLI